MCLAVTCYLHFWQNDRDILRAAAGNTEEERIPKYVQYEIRLNSTYYKLLIYHRKGVAISLRFLTSFDATTDQTTAEMKPVPNKHTAHFLYKRSFIDR